MSTAGRALVALLLGSSVAGAAFMALWVPATSATPASPHVSAAVARYDVVALQATPRPTEATTTSSTIVTAGATATPKSGDYKLAAVVIFVGLVVIVAVLLFIGVGEGRYYDTILEYARRGKAAPPTMVVHGTVLTAAAGDIPLVVSPAWATLLVGQSSGPFVVSTVEPGTTVTEVVWTTGDPASSDVRTDRQGSAYVTAKNPGAVTLTAKGQVGTEAAQGQVALAVVDPSQGGTNAGLPFLGEGFGAIVLALLVVTLSVALAIVGKIDGQGITALFGTILGYVFVKGASAAAGAKKADPGGDGTAGPAGS